VQQSPLVRQGCPETKQAFVEDRVPVPPLPSNATSVRASQATNAQATATVAQNWRDSARTAWGGITSVNMRERRLEIANEFILTVGVASPVARESHYLVSLDRSGWLTFVAVGTRRALAEAARATFTMQFAPPGVGGIAARRLERREPHLPRFLRQRPAKELRAMRRSLR
jgi:hypothetical protein